MEKILNLFVHHLYMLWKRVTDTLMMLVMAALQAKVIDHADFTGPEEILELGNLLFKLQSP